MAFLRLVAPDSDPGEPRRRVLYRFVAGAIIGKGSRDPRCRLVPFRDPRLMAVELLRRRLKRRQHHRMTGEAGLQ